MRAYTNGQASDQEFEKGNVALAANTKKWDWWIESDHERQRRSVYDKMKKISIYDEPFEQSSIIRHLLCQ